MDPYDCKRRSHLMAGLLGGWITVLCMYGQTQEPANDLWTPDSMGGWSIWTSDSPNPALSHAALEWQQFFNTATRHSLPIIGSSNLGSDMLWISPDSVLPKQFLEAPQSTEKLGEEDYQWQSTDQGILSRGGGPRGMIYGVYDWVEEILGVRFLTPDHTHVPAWDPQRSFLPSSRTYHPPLRFRWSYFGEIGEVIFLRPVCAPIRSRRRHATEARHPSN